VELDVLQVAELALCFSKSPMGPIPGDSRPSVKELASLTWLTHSCSRALVDAFPVSMLCSCGGHSDGDWSKTSPEDTDGFCCLLILHCLLRIGAVDTHAWLHHGAAGVLVLSLCAESVHVRGLGYQAVGAFLSLLSAGPSFAERPQAVQILSCLRDAVTEIDQRLPGISACFVAKGLHVLMRPSHAQYRPINHVVLSRPCLDLADAPLLFSHLLGTRTICLRQDRLWVLAMLNAGMHSDVDFLICERRHVLQLVISLHDSRADLLARRACLSLLQRLARLHPAAAQMLGPIGAPVWICDHLARDHEDIIGRSMLLLLLARSLSIKACGVQQIEQCAFATISLWRAMSGRIELQRDSFVSKGSTPRNISNNELLVMPTHVDIALELGLMKAVVWLTFPSTMLLDILCVAIHLDSLHVIGSDADGHVLRASTFVRVFSSYELSDLDLEARESELNHFVDVIDLTAAILHVNKASPCGMGDPAAVATREPMQTVPSDNVCTNDDVLTNWVEWLRCSLSKSEILAKAVSRRQRMCSQIVQLYRRTPFSRLWPMQCINDTRSVLSKLGPLARLNRLVLLLAAAQKSTSHWLIDAHSSSGHVDKEYRGERSMGGRCAKMVAGGDSAERELGCFVFEVVELARVVEPKVALVAEQLLGIALQDYWGVGNPLATHHMVEYVNVGAGEGPKASILQGLTKHLLSRLC